MNYLSESTSLLYTQLLSECLQGAAPTGRGLSFVTKKIKGKTHWYLQVTIGSAKSQYFIGPDSQQVRDLVAKEKSRWESAKDDAAERQKLVAMLVSGGAHTVSAAEARVFEVLERAGVFLVGGVIVGSHAFAIYANMLGVAWDSQATKTHDVDVASDDRLSIGLVDNDIDLKHALVESEMGFIEVPSLDRKSPSTTFRVWNKQLSVDILTPLIGRPTSKPKFIKTLNTFAEPVRFLDYLLEDVQPAVVVAKSGVLVNVPSPARYAIHKIVTSQRRVAGMHTKKLKDIRQAEQLFAVLLNDRPGDVLLAREAIEEMPSKFGDQFRQGLKALDPKLRQQFEAAM